MYDEIFGEITFDYDYVVKKKIGFMGKILFMYYLIVIGAARIGMTMVLQF